MKRLLRPRACMFGLSPKLMSLTVDIDFGIKECQVWTMLQKTKYEIFRCCSNFSKNTHHTVQSHMKRWIQISHESPYEWGYLRLNIWSGARGPVGDIRNWLSYVLSEIFATKDLEGSALETGTPMRSHMYPDGWKCLRCFWIHPGKTTCRG